MQTLVVTDAPEYWQFLSEFSPIVSASDYLSDSNYHQNQNLRIINLCHSYHYQSISYYVSLLAQARGHKAIPSVFYIQDVLNESLSKQFFSDIDEEIQQSLSQEPGDAYTLPLYFGQSESKRKAQLARKIHGLFPLPLLSVQFEKKKLWRIKKILPLSTQEIPEKDITFMQAAAGAYLSKKRFHQWRKKQHSHNLAILIDPAEKTPPSDKEALDLFIRAGEALDLNVDLIDKNDAKSIAEYDALFIRTTTAVNHYTYQLARRAIQENLIVIDDPQSIVKCSNKIYLAELLQRNQILTPRTLFVNKYDTVIPEVTFPCVLKKPDSAFSQGVIKLKNEKDLKKSLTQFFKTSDLVLIQPFIPTEFDWRIGVIDNKPLFACQYFMAKNHWQIYNWGDNQETVGDYETVPLDKVPPEVIKTALKATRLIGDGLYGVDIKSHNNQHYIIEVNDNPNIDSDVEDQVEGDQLYQTIMSVFLQRIRRKHGYV